MRVVFAVDLGKAARLRAVGRGHYVRRMKFRIATLSVAVAVAALAVFSARNGKRDAEPVPIPPAPVEEQMRDAIQIPTEGAAPVADFVTPEPRLPPRLELARGKLPWEEKIESVTGATDLNDAAKARRLLAMIPALPEHGLATAAEEAVKRLPDADYNAVALPVVVNPQTHGLVESVLFADLMVRPDAITLPALLRIAQIPNHPYARFAHDNLDLLLGGDYGADWLKWDAAVRRTLASGEK